MFMIVDSTGDKCQLDVICHECGRSFVSPIFTQEEWNRYQNGEHAQDVFPNWTPSERELFLISGICGDCFDRIMAEPDEDEEE